MKDYILEEYARLRRSRSRAWRLRHWLIDVIALAALGYPFYSPAIYKAYWRWLVFGSSSSPRNSYTAAYYKSANPQILNAAVKFGSGNYYDYRIFDLPELASAKLIALNDAGGSCFWIVLPTIKPSSPDSSWRVAGLAEIFKYDTEFCQDAIAIEMAAPMDDKKILQTVLLQSIKKAYGEKRIVGLLESGIDKMTTAATRLIHSERLVADPFSDALLKMEGFWFDGSSLRQMPIMALGLIPDPVNFSDLLAQKHKGNSMRRLIELPGEMEMNLAGFLIGCIGCLFLAYFMLLYSYTHARIIISRMERWDEDPLRTVPLCTEEILSFFLSDARACARSAALILIPCILFSCAVLALVAYPHISSAPRYFMIGLGYAVNPCRSIYVAVLALGAPLIGWCALCIMARFHTIRMIWLLTPLVVCLAYVFLATDLGALAKWYLLPARFSWESDLSQEEAARIRGIFGIIMAMPGVIAVAWLAAHVAHQRLLKYWARRTQ